MKSGTTSGQDDFSFYLLEEQLQVFDKITAKGSQSHEHRLMSDRKLALFDKFMVHYNTEMVVVREKLGNVNRLFSFHTKSE